MTQEPKFKPYLFTYRHDGAEWGFQILATSAADAKARRNALGTARYDGEVMCHIPVPAGGLALRIFKLVRHWFQSPP